MPDDSSVCTVSQQGLATETRKLNPGDEGRLWHFGKYSAVLSCWEPNEVIVTRVNLTAS